MVTKRSEIALCVRQFQNMKRNLNFIDMNRIRSSSMSHALRVKKSPIPGDDFLRFSRYSPMGHALRIKKGSSAHALRIKKGSSAHALRIKKGTSAYHALRVRRNGETDDDYMYSFVMPEHSFYKRPAYNSYVLRV